MPRLLGHKEPELLHLYDSFLLDGERRPGDVRLFGHPGPLPFTNITMPNRISSDITAIVQNWYASTSGTSATEDFLRWSSAAICELSIGSKVHNVRPLSELLARKPGQCDVNMDAGFADRVTETMYDAYQREVGTKVTWGDISKHERAAWFEAFRVARSEMQPARVITIIPVRQTFEARISWRNEDVTQSLVDDRLRVWLHLEGFATRDVC